MKTSKTHKNTTSNSHSSKPFFNKNGEGDFFSQVKETEAPFFSPYPIQTKLTIGQPNDKYEQEADMTAEKVVRKLENPNSFLPIQRKYEECEQEEKLKKKEEATEEIEVMRKPIFESGDDPRIQNKSIENQLSSSKGKGKPLTKDVRHNMESAFGVDFSRVKIHTDADSIQMNQHLKAKAFTHGSDVYFNQSEYNPQTNQGKQLLAHELTHVLQQKGMTNRRLPNPRIQRHFSDEYTSWWGGANEVEPGEVRSYFIEFQIDVAMEINQFGEESNNEIVGDLIQTVLNRHAGGRYQINGTEVYIRWHLNWRSPTSVLSGKALGISLISDEVLEATSANEDGMFRHEGEVSRILLRGSYAQRALGSSRGRRARREKERARRNFGNMATHEIGHALGLGHTRSTAMDASNSSRIDLRMSESQILEMLIRTRGGDPSALPPWLQENEGSSNPEIRRKENNAEVLTPNLFLFNAIQTFPEISALKSGPLIMRQNGGERELENDPNYLPRFRGVEDIIDLHLSSNGLLLNLWEENITINFTGNWVRGEGQESIRTEFIRRLDIKVERSLRNHLEWFIRYIENHTGDEGRKSWLLDEVRSRIHTLNTLQSQGGFTHPLYVDNFVEAVYDINDSPLTQDERGNPIRNYSDFLTVSYQDGTKIKISLNEIDDEPTVPSTQALLDSFYIVGRGGRTFPRIMNRGSVSNLWFAKRQALITMDDANMLLINLSIVPIMIVTTPTTVGGVPALRRVPRTRFPGYSTGGGRGGRPLWGRWNDYPHVSLDGREYAVINGRLYTRHAVDRMQPSGFFMGQRGNAPNHTGGQPQIRQAGGEYGRSVSPRNVEEVITTGTRNTLPPRPVRPSDSTRVRVPERTSFSSGSVRVITEGHRGDPAGIVITIVTR